jgi:hypothetical protein
VEVLETPLRAEHTAEQHHRAALERYLRMLQDIFVYHSHLVLTFQLSGCTGRESRDILINPYWFNLPVSPREVRPVSDGIPRLHSDLYTPMHVEAMPFLLRDGAPLAEVDTERPKI